MIHCVVLGANHARSGGDDEREYGARWQRSSKAQ